MKEVVGRTEVVEIAGKKFVAKIDTGSYSNSIDKKVAERLGLNQIVKIKKVKSASGESLRKVVREKIKIKNKTIKTTFTLANRKELRYDVLIGRKSLKNFLVDVKKCA